MYNNPNREVTPRGAALAAGLIILFIVGAIIAVAFLIPMYGRYQHLEGERNLVEVNDIRIRQTEQLVKVEQQKAQIRIQEANGIAAANKIINQTLTPQYLQHEAIQAQLESAKNSSHTETIYVPSGTQGIPNVLTVK